MFPQKLFALPQFNSLVIPVFALLLLFVLISSTRIESSKASQQESESEPPGLEKNLGIGIPRNVPLDQLERPAAQCFERALRSSFRRAACAKLTPDLTQTLTRLLVTLLIEQPQQLVG